MSVHHDEMAQAVFTATFELLLDDDPVELLCQDFDIHAKIRVSKRKPLEPIAPDWSDQSFDNREFWTTSTTVD